MPDKKLESQNTSLKIKTIHLNILSSTGTFRHSVEALISNLCILFLSENDTWEEAVPEKTASINVLLINTFRACQSRPTLPSPK